MFSSFKSLSRLENSGGSTIVASLNNYHLCPLIRRYTTLIMLVNLLRGVQYNTEDLLTSPEPVWILGVWSSLNAKQDRAEKNDVCSKNLLQISKR